MTPITFTGYGVRGEPVTVIAERITSFWPINYNGNGGTCIALDTGKEITVGESPSVVSMEIRRAEGKL